MKRRDRDSKTGFVGREEMKKGVREPATTTWSKTTDAIDFGRHSTIERGSDKNSIIEHVSITSSTHPRNPSSFAQKAVKYAGRQA